MPKEKGTNYLLQMHLGTNHLECHKSEQQSLFYNWLQFF